MIGWGALQSGDSYSYDSVWGYGRTVEGGCKWVYGQWAGKGTVAKFGLQSEVIVDGTMDFPDDGASVETTEMVAGVRGTETAQQDQDIESVDEPQVYSEKGYRVLFFALRILLFVQR